jgi:hypothetical protein
MIKRDNYAMLLKTAREALGLEWIDVPPLAGVDSSAYLDLEAHDDEIAIGVSANEVGRVLACLKLNPFELFAAEAQARGGAKSYSELAEALRAHLARNSLTVEAFGAEVGWDIRGAMVQPEQFGELPLDALSDICDLLRIDWRGLLN